MKRTFEWNERDRDLFRGMLITPPELEQEQAIGEPDGTLGRVARIIHSDGTETRRFCLSQDEAVEFIRSTINLTAGDDMVIENDRRSKDYDYRGMEKFDRRVM